MADRRINDLPEELTPTASEVVAIDGATTRKVNIQILVDTGAPVASQSEAQTGTNNSKRMTPLSTKQSIASEIGVSIASIAQGVKANTAVQSVNGKSGNAVVLEKGDISLGNVDNTSDANKPVSTAQQAALNLKADASITISAGTGLTGGGDLSSNRTILLNSASIASLALADSSVQTVNGVSPTSGNVDVSGEDAHIQDTRSSAILETIESNINFIVTAGYSSVGDGGTSMYRRVSSEPSHAGKFQSADGAWWEIYVDRPTPEMFGADGTGTASASTAVQAALDHFGVEGGVLYAFGVYLIDSNITIPRNVCFNFPEPFSGFGQASSQLFNQTGKVKLSSAATINLMSGSSFKGAIVLRSDMTGPEPNAANYAGTAFTVGGHYTKVSNTLIVGFSRAYISSGFNSGVFEKNRFDCNNGPRAFNDADAPLFFGNRGYPFGTIESPSRVETFDTTNWAYRSGIAYEFDTCAWPRELDNWDYGHNIGLRINSCSNPTSTSSNFEGQYTSTSPFVLSSAAIVLTGSTTGGKIVSPNCVHYINGIIQNEGASTAVNTITSPYVRDCSGNGIAAVTGGLNVDGYIVVGGQSNGPGTGGNGIRVISTTAPAIIGDGFVDGFGVGIRAAGNNVSFSGRPVITNCATKFNLEAPRFDIASAATITIPEYVTDVRITGTTAITNITATRAGHVVRLLFAAASSMANTGNIRLAGGSFTATAGHVVELYCEGATGSTVWREISRSLSV